MRSKYRAFLDKIGKSDHFAYTLICLFAGGLIAYINTISLSFYGNNDGKKYFDLAMNSVREGAFSCGLYEHAYWPVGWIETTATIYRTFGSQQIYVRYFLVLCALITTFVVYLWTKKLFGRLSAICALVLSTSTIFIYKLATYNQYEIFLSSLIISASYIIFVLWPQSSAKQILLKVFYGSLAAIFISFAVLSSSKTIVIGIILFFYILVKSLNRKTYATLIGYTLVGVLVGSLWSYRNYSCFEEFIPLSTNGGVVYFIGNGPNTINKKYVDPFLPYKDITPQSIKAHESERWYAYANGYIKDNPVISLKRWLTRFLLFFNPHFADQALVLLLFLISLYKFIRKRKNVPYEVKYWLIVIFSVVILHAIFHFETRYVMPVWPFLSMFAVGAWKGWERS